MTLRVSNLEKYFDGNKVIDHTSFDIEPNQITLLIGPNGSGKTTLVNLISGLIRADRGNITFDKKDITKSSPDAIFKMGMIRTFQKPRLFRNLSVMENILLAKKDPIGEKFRYAMFHSKWSKNETTSRKTGSEILSSLGLDLLQNNLGYDLSGGQIKLLELGKVLMIEPKLIILDEPIAGINPKLAHTIFEKIKSMAKNTTFLIIEHRLDIALDYADKVIVLDHGKIIATDTPDKILDNKKVINCYL
jgi:branched-chain amino acid transport system ATP-binding protein